MSSSNCCFLTCIQVSQEAGQVVWYSISFRIFHSLVMFKWENRRNQMKMLHFSVQLFSVASLMLKQVNFTCFSEKFAASLNSLDLPYSLFRYHPNSWPLPAFLGFSLLDQIIPCKGKIFWDANHFFTNQSYGGMVYMQCNAWVLNCHHCFSSLYFSCFVLFSICLIAFILSFT